MARPDGDPLGPFVQADETLVGGKGGPNKQLVLVAAEANGRVRLAHADNNDETTLKAFADREIATEAHVVTDGLASYNARSLGERSHEAHVQTKAERRENDAVQACHWMTSLTKRWLLGTHAGAVAPKHLQAYLDEYTFRHNRRRTKGVGRIAARLIESLMIKPPLIMRAIVNQTMPFRQFKSPVISELGVQLPFCIDLLALALSATAPGGTILEESSTESDGNSQSEELLQD